jgi:hypothetical protein
MRRLCLLFAVMVIALGQDQDDVRLPNGKLQRDEIIQAEHKRNLEDADALARLAQEVKEDLDNSDSHIVSVKTLKKLDDIEKLDKAIRGRLKRN